MPPKRRYVSPLREQAAARTRELILGHATELFAERGYGRVTVADIASAAGVASKTVFASVGSKGDILDHIVDRGVLASGYDQAMQELLELRSPEAVLKALAHGTRLGNEGQFAVHEAIRKALPVHENGEELWERATAAYRDALRTAARHLHSLTPPASHSAKETGDLLWYWFGPTGWRTLVVENGWSWDRAEEVLYGTAVAALR
ncbi:TetR/AcrR family transcriptional regulator [Streptomyces sp. MBT62]|uniref:TetR/AcrR family transcriptional regulator n=1 Tax=Streptomyces sp. MBT62 TaxID=2800410 RepID=UPI00190AFD4C|nr:TetR/AcrR family transcriptional regulator [Streptomyces sp. MBT62]MBK3567229.1 TetR/AcrR family transcriptional regulator [Streptomyces sp. MBT62]